MAALRRIPRPVPRPFMVMGLLWLLVAAYLTVIGTRDALSAGASPDTLLWPGLGLLALCGGVGLMTGRSYARGLIAFLAGLGLLGVAALLVAAFYPQQLFWWLGVSVAAFFAWSLFFVIKLWPDYEVLLVTAG